MSYLKIENNIVVQKQPENQTGFISVHDSIVCGMIHDGGTSFAKQTFSNPPTPPKIWEEVRELQRSMIVQHQDTIEIHEREVAHNGTIEANYTITVQNYQDFLTYFQDIRDNDDNLHSDPDVAVAALNGLSAPI